MPELTSAQRAAIAAILADPTFGEVIESEPVVSAAYGTVSSTAAASTWTLCSAQHPDEAEVTRDGVTVVFEAGSPCERSLKSAGHASIHGIADGGHVPMYARSLDA